MSENYAELAIIQREEHKQHTPQETSNLPRVTGDGNPSILITIKNLIQHRLGPNILVNSLLSQQRLPEEIRLGKVLLELVAGE